MPTDYLPLVAMFLASLLLGLLMMRPNTKLRVSIATFSFEIERSESAQTQQLAPKKALTAMPAAEV